MRFDPKNPRYPGNDRFVLSKGHAAPLLYAAWAEAGHIPEKELLTLRKLDSPLEGHPTPRLDFVDVATGSLGQGLSAGAGMSIVSDLDQTGFRTYVLLGDGELAEGSVWEAANFAGVRKLKNLVAILDINRLGQNGPTAFGWDIDLYRKRFESFGWKAIEIDGHSIPEIMKAFEQIGTSDQPFVIVAKTVKGKGIPGVEDQLNWHGKPLSKDKADQAIAYLQPMSMKFSESGLEIPKPPRAKTFELERPIQFPEIAWDKDYPKGKDVPTRKAFGNALVRAGSAIDSLVVLDGDVGNSTHTDQFRDKYPDRFIECYIGEQNMVGVAVGMSKLGKIPVCATFGTFFTRAMDQIRMGAISFADVKLVGTHNGVSIGEDGTSQMGLEDVACLRAIEGSIVLCASDAVSAERLVEEMIETDGMVYLRTGRPAVPVIYGRGQKFEVGGAHILRSSSDDQLTIVASGVTVIEAIKASEQLAAKGIRVRVIDAYSIKPLARDVILKAAQETGAQVITVEDHYPQGGLGEAVAAELSPEGVRVYRLAVYELPHSGTEKELLRKYRLDADSIAAKVQEVLRKRRTQAA